MMVLGVTMWHVYEADGSRIEFPLSNFFVRRRKRRLFIVNMRGSGIVLHAIFIDTGEEPGLIYDSPEPHAM